MSQGLREIQGLQTASPRALQIGRRRPALLQFPLCVSKVIGDVFCARAALHMCARAAPG